MTELKQALIDMVRLGLHRRSAMAMPADVEDRFMRLVESVPRTDGMRPRRLRSVDCTGRICDLPWYEIGGWYFAAFDDPGSWDYVEWVQEPGGRRYEYAELPDRVKNWEPTEEQKAYFPFEEY